MRWRLTLAMLLVFVLGLGAAAIFSVWEVSRAEERAHERSLQNQARELLAALRPTAGGAAAIVLPPGREEAFRRPDALFAYTLYDAAQQPIALSPNLGKPLPRLGVSGRNDFGSVQTLDPEGQAALAARAPDGYMLVVARNRLDQETLAKIFLDELSEFSLVFVPFGMISLALLWLIGGWSLRPLARASREAMAIGSANPSGRISLDGLPHEIQPLVKAVNGALERLERAYAAQRRLTADAAHELRTPLAVLSLRLQQAKLEAAVDWPAVERDLAQMGRLIGQLMDLARKEDPARVGDAARQRPLNLSRLVREAAMMVLPLAEKSGRPLEVEAPDIVTVHGRPDDLQDAICNLLDNALVHGEGVVRATVCQHPDGDSARAVVEVADQGAGIPAELQEAVFERFRKAVPTSPGAGLGLAIVREVARAHCGEVCVQPGLGFRIQLSLPLLSQSMLCEASL
jgi:two-component system sensor histidine kinase TctE